MSSARSPTRPVRGGRAAPSRRPVADRRRLDGDGAAGRSGQRDHGIGASRRRLRRDGESRRERPDRPHPIKRARTTFTYIAVATAGTDAQKDGVSPRGEPGARAGLLHARQSGVVQRVRSRTAAVGGGLPLQGRRRHLPHLRRRDGRRGSRSRTTARACRWAPRCRCRRRCGRPDRAAFDRYWQESLDKVHIDDAVREYLYPIAVCRVRGVRPAGAGCGGCSEVFALLITTGFSAATVSRRDAVAVGRQQATALRPADGGTAHGERAAAAVRPAVPVQPHAVGPGPPDQDGAPVGLGAVPSPRRRKVGWVRSEGDTWDITTSVGSTALFVATARALEAQKARPAGRRPLCGDLLPCRRWFAGRRPRRQGTRPPTEER